MVSFSCFNVIALEFGATTIYRGARDWPAFIGLMGLLVYMAVAVFRGELPSTRLEFTE